MWGEITRYGIKMMANGDQWVINALNGQVMKREDANFIADRRKNIMWVSKSHKVTIADQPSQYKWNNPR